MKLSMEKSFFSDALSGRCSMENPISKILLNSQEDTYIAISEFNKVADLPTPSNLIT